MSNSFATTWNLAHQAPLSLEFSRQEYWSGLPFPSPEDLPDPGIKPTSPALETDSSLSELPGVQSVYYRNVSKLRNIPAYGILPIEVIIPRE